MIALILAGMAWAGCVERPLVPDEPGTEELESPCGWLRLRMPGRLYATTPATGISRGVMFDGARSDIAITFPGDVSARLGLLPATTGGASGYVGINGEAWVNVINLADVRWDWKETGLALSAGIVDDPWTVHELRVWSIREIAPGAGQAEGWFPRSDVGGWIAWTTPGRWATVNVSLLSGEGANRRERNNGVDVAVQAIVRPIPEGDALEIVLHGQEGSRGLLSARNHRAGLMISGGPDFADFGGQLLAGWGAGGDASLTPGGASFYARTDDLPVLAWLRADHVRSVRSDAATGVNKLFAGVGPRIPWSGDRPRPAHLVVGGEARMPQADAGPTAGQPQNSFTGFIQLTGHIQADWSMEAP